MKFTCTENFRFLSNANAPSINWIYIPDADKNYYFTFYMHSHVPFIISYTQIMQQWEQNRIAYWTLPLIVLSSTCAVHMKVEVEIYYRFFFLCLCDLQYLTKSQSLQQFHFPNLFKWICILFLYARCIFQLHNIYFWHSVVNMVAQWGLQC